MVWKYLIYIFEADGIIVKSIFIVQFNNTAVFFFSPVLSTL